MNAPEKIEKLKHRFFALWRRCLNGRGEADPEPVWNDLLQHYSESSRHYHRMEHVLHCLEQHDLALAEMADPDAVEMALWFHDAIYKVRSPDNERRSAELFQRVATDRFGSLFVARVHRLILATDHRVPPATRDQELMVDIDLSSIALPWEGYLRDIQALRRESGEVADERYYAGHRRFLNGLTKRRSIFHSGFFQRCCEERARSNIHRYLNQLETDGRIAGPADTP